MSKIRKIIKILGGVMELSLINEILEGGEERISERTNNYMRR